MGSAIFKLVSKESLEAVKGFGRLVGDKLGKDTPGLVVPGRPHDVLVKFLAIQARLYSFRFFEKGESTEQRFTIDFFSYPDIKCTHLLAESICGTMERLLELSGAKNIRTRVIGEDARKRSLEVRWE